MEPGRTYGGASAAARRADRRERLIAAALTVIERDGVGGLTVRKTAATAGVSPRYLYEAFRDLDDLLASAFDGATQEVADTALKAVASASGDLRGRLTGVVEALVAYLVDQPNKASLLLTGSLGDPALAAQRAAMTERFAGVFAQTVLMYLAPGEDGPRAIALVARFVVGATAETFSAWSGGTLTYRREVLVHDLVELFAATIATLDRLGGA